MIIVDAALKAREGAGTRGCAAMIGAGFVAWGVANQIVRRNLPRDMALTYEDVKVPEDRLCDRLRREQDRHLLG